MLYYESLREKLTSTEYGFSMLLDQCDTAFDDLCFSKWASEVAQLNCQGVNVYNQTEDFAGGYYVDVLPVMEDLLIKAARRSALVFNTIYY